MNFSKALNVVTDEIAATLRAADVNELAALADAVVKAKRVVLAGQGRSGLVARAFGMRLAHLGLAAQIAGDATTTAIGTGDLLVAVSCSGATEITCHLAKKAKSAGAKCVGLTANRRSRLGRMCDLVVHVSAPSKDRRRRKGGSIQFGSTLFEQCCLILLDALCLVLAGRLDQSNAEMMSRHWNLE